MAKPKKTAGKSARRPTPARERLRVAVTGAAGWFGKLLVPALAAEPGIEQVLCLDIKDPGFTGPKIAYLTLDLTNPSADRLLADVLSIEKANAFAHAAFLSAPSPDQGYAHELMVIGTVNVLNACAEMKIGRIVALSTTLVYGARPDNPNFLAEDAPLRGREDFPYVQDRIEVEQLLARHASRHPETTVAILRPCAVMGPNSREMRARYLRAPIVPTLIGYDPVMQFVHESDLVRAFAKCLLDGAAGPFNVAGDGVLPLSSAVRILGNINWPVIAGVARTAAAGLWYAGLTPFPPQQLDLLRYILVADGRQMRDELGFHPSFNSREALAGVRGY